MLSKHIGQREKQEKGKKTSSNITCLQQTETLRDGMERDGLYALACLLRSDME